MSEQYPVERMSKRAFNGLLEYSTSLPTGTRIGKTRKRRLYNRAKNCWLDEWLIGEYVHHSDPDLVGIEWRRIEIKGEGSEE